MNEKEISELRRRFRPDRCSITHIHGCYVNEQKEIISQFNQPLALMPQEESEELLAILKKTLSGTVGKNLVELSFSTQQVLDGEEHKLLMALRDSALENDSAVQEFFQRVIQSLTMEGNYLILLACDKYDVPAFSKDGEKQDDSSEVFTYYLCSVCSVKPTKPALGYDAAENTFRNTTANWIVSAPELGFLFPAFNDRSADIYSAVTYSRNPAESHAEFIDAIFKTAVPMPATEQKETFQSVLSSSVAEDCSLDVIQAVHDQLTGMVEEQKENRDAEPPAVSKGTVKNVLQSCGVPEPRVAAFEQAYDSGFGADTQISARNLVDTKQFELRTPDVTIRVNPERSDLIETRVIDGAKYILVHADDGVEVNGVSITIT